MPSAQVEFDIETLESAHRHRYLVEDSKKARPCEPCKYKNRPLSDLCALATSKIRAQTSAWRRNNAPQRPLSSQAARDRPYMTSGAAASAHPGQLTAVGPARAPSPGNRRPRLEGPGRENLAAGSAVAGGKCEAYAAAPIGQASPRSAASAELPAAAGQAAFTEIHWKGALARAERAGKAPARLGLVLRLCALVSLKRPRGSAAPPDGHSRRAREPLAGRHGGGRAGGGPAGRLGPRLCSGGGRKGSRPKCRRWQGLGRARTGPSGAAGRRHHFQEVMTASLLESEGTRVSLPTVEPQG